MHRTAAVGVVAAIAVATLIVAGLSTVGTCWVAIQFVPAAAIAWWLCRRQNSPAAATRLLLAVSVGAAVAWGGVAWNIDKVDDEDFYYEGATTGGSSVTVL